MYIYKNDKHEPVGRNATVLKSICVALLKQTYLWSSHRSIHTIYSSCLLVGLLAKQMTVLPTRNVTFITRLQVLKQNP